MRETASESIVLDSNYAAQAFEDSDFNSDI